MNEITGMSLGKCLSTSQTISFSALAQDMHRESPKKWELSPKPGEAMTISVTLLSMAGENGEEEEGWACGSVMVAVLWRFQWLCLRMTENTRKG